MLTPTVKPHHIRNRHVLHSSPNPIGGSELQSIVNDPKREQIIFVPQTEMCIVQPEDYSRIGGPRAIFTNGMGPCLGVLIGDDKGKIALGHFDGDSQWNGQFIINFLLRHFPPNKTRFICLAGGNLNAGGEMSLAKSVRNVYKLINIHYGDKPIPIISLIQRTDFCYYFEYDVIDSRGLCPFWTSHTLGVENQRNLIGEYYNTVSVIQNPIFCHSPASTRPVVRRQ